MHYNMHEDYDEENDLIELDEMILNGDVWACCPNCLNFVDSAFERKCFVCKHLINYNELIIKFLDWKISN